MPDLGRQTPLRAVRAVSLLGRFARESLSRRLGSQAVSGVARLEEFFMCVRVTCPTCGKPTWRGCGAHAESVLAGVPKDQRCRCRENATEKTPSESPVQGVPLERM
jgi:hypothetical protein